MLYIQKFEVQLQLKEDLLGTVPKNKDVYTKYIASKIDQYAAKAEKAAEKNNEEARLADGTVITPTSVSEKKAQEIETIKELEEKGWSGFHEDEQGPFLFDYAVRGFMQESARTIVNARNDEDEDDEKIKQLADKIKRFCFVMPRQVRLVPIDAKPLERPLRAMTAQGPRVTVVKSDKIKANSVIDFKLDVLKGGQITKAVLEDVFAYGQYIGLGQWRSGGYGRFELKKLKVIS